MCGIKNHMLALFYVRKGKMKETDLDIVELMIKNIQHVKIEKIRVNGSYGKKK